MKPILLVLALAVSLSAQTNPWRRDGTTNTISPRRSGDSLAIGATVLSPATAEPACDAAHRGQVVRVQGGAGVADTYRECVKTAADTYAWQGVGGSGALPAGCSDSGANGITCTGVIAAAGFSTGDAPPAVTPGTGGVWAPKEGTVPSVGAAAGVDVCYADSTAHNILCSTNNGAYYPMTRTITSGTTALAVSEIAANSCQAVTEGTTNSTAATGALTTDTLDWDTSGSTVAIDGYVPPAKLTIRDYLTAGFVNFDVCNETAAAVTPGALTLNWKVRR